MYLFSHSRRKTEMLNPSRPRRNAAFTPMLERQGLSAAEVGKQSMRSLPVMMPPIPQALQYGMFWGCVLLLKPVYLRK
jgi:hypothetical protein